ncbi:MAG TPA: MauE/DoxX family redox-associated membrane protein [Tepidisphaeraceae bacterium]|jgi:uncharacterized membrane protein YphA (DoxX/SURF4 family)|nr:MauE/DoxX family redox-associated membrane protein [Tepidisphaeraceae bacterium]
MMKTILLVLRLSLGALLLYGGLAKFKSPYEFLAAVNAYAMTTPATSLLIAAVLPWLEMVLGVCLIGGVLVQGAMFLTVLLFALFTVATSSAWLRGLPIDCGCFGGAGDKIGGYLVARSVTMFLLSLLGCGIELSRQAHGRSFTTVAGRLRAWVRAVVSPVGRRHPCARHPGPSHRVESEVAAL